jgi:hypothetical protein
MVGELPNHIELIYKNAEDNLRFIKQQQWVNYSVRADGLRRSLCRGEDDKGRVC